MLLLPSHLHTHSMPLELFIKPTCICFGRGFVWHSSKRSVAPQFTHSPIFSRLSLPPLSPHCALSNIKISALLLCHTFYHCQIKSAPAHTSSMYHSPCTTPFSGPYLANPLKKKVKGSGWEYERGGHLAACALTSIRLAGVINRWLASGEGHGVVEKKKGEIKI